MFTRNVLLCPLSHFDFQQEFGRQLIGPQEQLRKATVILNPAACNG